GALLRSAPRRRLDDRAHRAPLRDGSRLDRAGQRALASHLIGDGERRGGNVVLIGDRGLLSEREARRGWGRRSIRMPFRNAFTRAIVGVAWRARWFVRRVTGR